MELLTLTPRAATSFRRPRAVRAPRRLRRVLATLTPSSWMCIDILIIGLGTIGACTLLTMGSTEYSWLASPWLVTTTFCASMLVAGLVFGLYERDTLLSRGRIVMRGGLSVVLAVTVALAALMLLFYAGFSRWIGLVVGLAFLLVGVPLRLVAHELISAARLRLLCIGAGDSIRRLVDVLRRCHRRHYQVLGHVRVDTARHGTFFQSEADTEFAEHCPCLGGIDEVARLLAAHQVDEVVVDSELAGVGVISGAVATCLESPCRVTDQATFVEKLLGEVPAESITTDWFLRADVQHRGHHDTVSRLLDMAAAAVGLVLTLPLWPLIGLLVRLDSRGPALFRQLRVGQHGRVFTIYKFRTMRTDAEQHGARWAEQNDTRVTRVGRFLRRSRLDELPQLFNILRGDMALVGPRPERPEFVHDLEQLLPHYRLRHLIRPGLTGWAQIHYGYGASVADAHRKLCFDLYYLKHRCLELDLAILIRTFGTFVLGAR